MTASFTELGLSQELLKAVEDLGFEEPSPHSGFGYPGTADGKGCRGPGADRNRQNGGVRPAHSGKNRFRQERAGAGALPYARAGHSGIRRTEQTGRTQTGRFGFADLRRAAIERQLRALAKGAQVVVGTPGRVIDHLQRGTLRLNEARIVVLDEADEMLDMGFREDIELILEQSPADCQRVLFSATMPQPIRELSKRFLREPEMLTIAHKMLTVPAIEQVYYEVRPYQKMDALCRVLDSQGFRKALVFCATKRSVDEITVHLQQRGYQPTGCMAT